MNGRDDGLGYLVEGFCDWLEWDSIPSTWNFPPLLDIFLLNVRWKNYCW